MRLFSLLSLFSYFAAVERCVPTYGVKGEGQPTRCGHTLRGVPCRGWRVAAPLRTLQRQKP